MCRGGVDMFLTWQLGKPWCIVWANDEQRICFCPSGLWIHIQIWHCSWIITFNLSVLLKHSIQINALQRYSMVYNILGILCIINLKKKSNVPIFLFSPRINCTRVNSNHFKLLRNTNKTILFKSPVDWTKQRHHTRLEHISSVNAGGVFSTLYII